MSQTHKLTNEARYRDSAHLKIIKKTLKNTKTCCTDNIDSYVLKVAADQLVLALTDVVNLSLTHAHFSTLWKTAKVIPLLKMTATAVYGRAESRNLSICSFLSNEGRRWSCIEGHFP